MPADAAVVAYANVRDVMHSQLRQRFREMEPTREHQNQFEEKTGLNFEKDIDTVVAAMMPMGNLATDPEGAFLILAKGRFDAIAGQAGLPTEIASQMPAITWFSAAGHVNSEVLDVLEGLAKGRKGL